MCLIALLITRHHKVKNNMKQAMPKTWLDYLDVNKTVLKVGSRHLSLSACTGISIFESGSFTILAN